MDFPGVLRIEPASACNLRCIHCPTGTLDMPRTVMTKETFDLLYTQIRNLYIRVFVLYHGGEPFLNKHLFYFANKLRSSHPNSFIKVVSNGMLLTDDIIKSLISSPINQIEFSLDGLDPADSSAIRRGSDSHKVLRVIRQLLDTVSQVNSSLKVIVTSTQFFDPSFNVLPTSCSPLAPSWIVNYLKGAHQFKCFWAMVWPRMAIHSDLDILHVTNPYQEDHFLSHCDHAENTITVRANGDVVPCCYDLMSDLVLGNITKLPILDIFSSVPYQTFINSLRSSNPVETCSNCNVIRKDKRYLIKQPPQQF